MRSTGKFYLSLDVGSGGGRIYCTAFWAEYFNDYFSSDKTFLLCGAACARAVCNLFDKLQKKLSSNSKSFDCELMVVEALDYKDCGNWIRAFDVAIKRTAWSNFYTSVHLTCESIDMTIRIFLEKENPFLSHTNDFLVTILQIDDKYLDSIFSYSTQVTRQLMMDIRISSTWPKRLPIISSSARRTSLQLDWQTVEPAFTTITLHTWVSFIVKVIEPQVVIHWFKHPVVRYFQNVTCLLIFVTISWTSVIKKLWQFSRFNCFWDFYAHKHKRALICSVNNASLIDVSVVSFEPLNNVPSV